MNSPAVVAARENSIGALRLLLASLVIYSHAGLLGGFGPEWLFRWSGGTIVAGTVAVQGFFILSGWLVTQSWIRHPSFPQFLWHRFLRVAPGLWLCLFVVAFIFTPIMWWVSRDPENFFRLSPSPQGYFWRNLFLPRSQTSIGQYPSGNAWGVDWNGSLWTLFYEGACYLMLGVAGFMGLLTRWRRTASVLIFLILLLNIGWQIAGSGLLLPLVGRVFDTPGKQLTLHFLAGAVLGMWPVTVTAFLRHRAGVPLASVALVFAWHTTAHGWLSPFLLPIVVLGLGLHGPGRNFERRLHGDYSYGIYLYGYPAQQLLAFFGLHHLGYCLFLFASFGLAIPLAIASWFLVESRSLRLKGIVWSKPTGMTVPA